MSFLSKKNEYLLYDVTTEYVKIDHNSFSVLFAEFGKTRGNQGMTLMEMNQQFLLSIINRNSPSSPSSSSISTQSQFQQQQQQQQQQIMPSRPQGARSKNVSFDEQLELHKQHFQQFAMPPPPTPPNFKDADVDIPPDNLELLMRKAQSERKYDALPPSGQQGPRKLQIGSVIEDDNVKGDFIDIDKLNKRSPPQTPSPPSPENAFSFFSKLKRVDTILEPEPEPQQLIPTPAIESLITTVANLSAELADTKDQVRTLFAEINHLKSLLSTSHPDRDGDILYNPELKESPLHQIKD
jgi:hypothetical protein